MCSGSSTGAKQTASWRNSGNGWQSSGWNYTQTKRAGLSSGDSPNKTGNEGERGSLKRSISWDSRDPGSPPVFGGAFLRLWAGSQGSAMRSPGVLPHRKRLLQLHLRGNRRCLYILAYGSWVGAAYLGARRFEDQPFYLLVAPQLHAALQRKGKLRRLFKPP